MAGILLGTVSCGKEEMQEIHTQVDVAEKSDNFKSKAEKLDVIQEKQEEAAVQESGKYSVSFDEDEVFLDEICERAAEHIDPYIRNAVVLMNTMEDDQYQVLSCDYESREKERDFLESELSQEIYDTILEKTQAFEDYYFHENDYESEYFFGEFITALEALRIDHRELFLYSDAQMGYLEYSSGYYMPGKWLDSMCDDRQAIRDEVRLFQCVIERILEKMPSDLNQYEKCCYFAFVIALAAEYDDTQNSISNYFQVYDTLMNGLAVCQGYAQTFYYLCREAGISCWYCSGTNGGFHAWNYIDTKEGPVYVDLTWFDTPELSADYREGNEQYLFMTQNDMNDYGYELQTIGWQ